jgi:hypothetical protein
VQLIAMLNPNQDKALESQGAKKQKSKFKEIENK